MARLVNWFSHYIGCGDPTVIVREVSKNIAIQFDGFEVVLSEDGTYYLNDTSGG